MEGISDALSKPKCEWKETEIGKIPLSWELKSIDEIKSKDPKSIISGPFGQT